MKKKQSLSNPKSHALLWRIVMFAFIAASCLIISGCSGDNIVSGTVAGDPVSEDDDTSPVISFKMPTEISAVPTKSTNTGEASGKPSLSFYKAVKAVTSVETPITDYSLATPRKYVEENTLKQFQMVDVVLDAVNQTNYLDHINAGPYKSMVSFKDESEGVQRTMLEPWVVSAEALKEDGRDVLQLSCWIEEEGEIVKGQFKIYAPPTQNEDGSYSSYGEWTLNVKFDEAGTDNYFAVSCVPDGEGSLLMVHDKEDGRELNEPAMEIIAIMKRNSTSGYGLVSYPDFGAYWDQDGDQTLTEYPVITAKYAYNENYLGISLKNDITNAFADPIYKNRNDIVEMVHEYGIFHNLSGMDINRGKSFGFPVRIQAQNGDGQDITVHSYYGSYQGRHQLSVSDDITIPENAVITREDVSPTEDPEIYSGTKTFNGTLVKKELVSASLNDIKNIPVETRINNNYNLMYSSTDMVWELETPNGFVDFSNAVGFDTIKASFDNNQKYVSIEAWDGISYNQYLYLGAGDITFYDPITQSNVTKTITQADFYLAQWVLKDGRDFYVPELPLTPIDTTTVQWLSIWMSGRTYIEFNGTGWIEKEVIDFDERHWQPVFGNNDTPFTLPMNKQLYMNLKDTSYTVEKTFLGIIVQQEIKTVITPGNLAELIPDDTIFVDRQDPANYSTYRFVADPTHANDMMLVFRTIGFNHKDADGNALDGVVFGGIAKDCWSITGIAPSGENIGDFNWEYSASNDWSSVTYLLDENGDYVLLDDPVRFHPLTLSGDKTINLQYDGHISGLPDMHEELEKNNWTMTSSISDKIQNIPAGTELTGIDGTEYLIKPLEISQFLAVATGISESDKPVFSHAESLDLNDAPVFTEHNMGDLPADTPLLYSEGLSVSEVE